MDAGADAGGGDTGAVSGLGYADPQYAASLAEFGQPRALTASGGWLLQRRLPGETGYDAMGCYPLFACTDWSRLSDDLSAVDDLVTVTLVTDPFGAPSEAELRGEFDVVLPFKEHYVLDLGRSPEDTVARHHRKSARKAERFVTIEPYDPTEDLDTWNGLYSHLVERHGITGIRAFSADSFAMQSELDGMFAWRARRGDVVVGMHWYLAAGDVVYAHLAAMHPDSYRQYAAHGLFWAAIKAFAGEFRWLDLGAAAGVATSAGDGLSEFKAGWSSHRRPTYVCGRVLDADRYASLVPGSDAPVTYFPPYRHGEFGARR